MLLCQFGEQEVKDSVMACAGDRSPGPDGYTLVFVIHCWEVVKNEVWAAIQSFDDQCIFREELRCYLYSIGPQNVGAKELKDFTLSD